MLCEPVLVKKCSGAPVSGCSSLEEEVGGGEREVFGLLMNIHDI